MPFHVVNDNLFAAIESCKRALPDNSRLLLINTIGKKKMLAEDSEFLVEINVPKANYVQALRHGIGATESQYIALMNSDDLVDVNRFTRQIDELVTSGRELCVTNLLKFAYQAKTKQITIPPLLGNPPRHFHEALLLLGSFRADASWCFKFEWAEENNLFSSDRDVTDWCAGMRVMKSTNTVVIPESLYFYRMHPGQATRSGNQINTDLFYSNWLDLNQSMNLKKLSIFEIDMLTSVGRANNKDNLNNVWIWLNQVEELLKQELPSSDHKSIEDVLSRRRILLCLNYHQIHISFQDLKFYPKVLFEYLRYKSFLREKIDIRLAK